MFISVVIPIYNCADYIGRALESIQKQVYKQYEIIIVDDGSTDNSAQVVNDYTKTLNIKYLSQENQGPSVARNKGISVAHGDAIAFLDADDVWQPQKLLKQVEMMKTFPDIGLVASDYYVINDKSQERVRGYDGYISPRKLYVKNILLTSSVLVRKECIDDVGTFNAKYHFGEDWELWLRIALKYKIFILPDRLCGYHTNRDGSITQRYNNKNMQDWYDIILKNWDMVGRSCRWAIPHRMALSWYYFNSAYVEQLNNNLQQSRFFLYKSACNWPFTFYNGKNPIFSIIKAYLKQAQKIVRRLRKV